MHVLILVNMNLNTQCKVSSFTLAKDTMKPKNLKLGCVADHSHLRVICHSEAWCNYPCTQTVSMAVKK